MLTPLWCVCMHTKRRITLLIDEETLKEGQELGLNLSKTCENCLKVIINALKNSYSQITAYNNGNSDMGVLRAGFEPASPARKAGILDRAILPERLASCKCFLTRINFIFLRLFLSILRGLLILLQLCSLLARSGLF